jgi:RNA polymerase sigma-70 factor (ECF subfamily)
MTSESLYEKIKVGDEKAFELLFRENYAGLVQFAWGYVRSKAVAEELVQDVFLKVWDNREDLNITKSINSYLYQSVRNRCTDWARHAEVVKKWEDESKFDQENKELNLSSVNKDLHHRLLLKEIEKAIHELPEKRREVFLLSRYENKSYKEIAELLEITVSTVETHMSKALKTLRDKFLPFLVFIIAFIIEQYH